MARRLVRWLAVGVMVAALAACQPIRVDNHGNLTSVATWVVEPATVAGRSGVEIRMRDCQEMVIMSPGSSGQVFEVDTIPVVTVVDARGVEVFDNAPWNRVHTNPAGATVVDGGDDDAHVVRIPTSGAVQPLRFRGYCSGYQPGDGIGFDPVWAFPSCTTSTRRCGPTAKGQGTLTIFGMPPR